MPDSYKLLSVIIPVYNEKTTISEVIEKVSAVELPIDKEIIVIDDGSTDGSMSLLSRLHGQLPNVVVVHLRRNFGKAAALQAGFLEARGEIIVTIDADLQDDPAEIPRFLAKLDAFPEADGSSVLDNSVLLYGSGMSDSDLHNSSPLPLAVFGRAGGRIKGNQHLVYAEDTPYNNFLLTLLERAAVPTESVGTSTGDLAEV